MKRILFSLLFALLTLSASAQSDFSDNGRRTSYRGNVAVSAGFVPWMVGCYSVETTNGALVNREQSIFVGGGVKWTRWWNGMTDPEGNTPTHDVTALYARFKYVLPNKRMKVNFFVSGDLGVGFWTNYNLDKCIARTRAGVYANGDLGMAIRLHKHLSLDLSVGMWGVLDESGSPYLKIGFTF